MDWEQIRGQYPQQWVVVEALDGVTHGAHRIINQLAFSGAFADWEGAWQAYSTLHNADKWREYYVIHTDRRELNIGVIESFGRVIA